MIDINNIKQENILAYYHDIPDFNYIKILFAKKYIKYIKQSKIEKDNFVFISKRKYKQAISAHFFNLSKRNKKTFKKMFNKGITIWGQTSILNTRSSKTLKEMHDILIEKVEYDSSNKNI